jgi:hypothetical protein
MSNCAFPLSTIVVKDPLLDFVKPVYTIREPSSLKSFTSQDITTFSNNQVNAQLNLNSTNFVIDTNLIYEQPITITINGSTTGGNILQDGCFALRSHALAKIMNTLELKYSSTSYSYQVADTINFMEHYHTYTNEKYNSDFDLAMLDASQNYDDLVASNRNPLANYTSGYDNVLHRGSYPVVVVSNSASQAVITTTLRGLLMSPPLRDQLIRGGAAQGLSHLSTLGVNINFVGNIGNRVLSLVRNRPTDVLTVSAIGVEIGMPTFSFTQIKSKVEDIPQVLSFNMATQERYPYSITLPLGVPTVLNVSSFTLTRIPHSIVFGARPSNNAYFNAANGAFITDTFAAVSNIVVQYDGQNLLSSSTNAQIYKMCYENGLVDNFLQFSGQPTLRSVGAGQTPPSYLNGCGSVVKLHFGKDISLYPKLAVGGANNTSISMSITLTNLNANTNDFTFYMILIYDDVIQFYDNNLAQISMIPLSQADIANAKGSERVHHELIRGHDLTGSGLFSSATNLVKSGALMPLITSLKSALSDPAFRSGFKDFLRSSGHPNTAAYLESVGFGARRAAPRKGRRGGARSGGEYAGGDYEGGEYEGGEYEGGAVASRSSLASSLYE